MYKEMMANSDQITRRKRRSSCVKGLTAGQFQRSEEILHNVDAVNAMSQTITLSFRDWNDRCCRSQWQSRLVRKSIATATVAAALGK